MILSQIQNLLCILCKYCLNMEEDNNSKKDINRVFLFLMLNSSKI